MKAIFFDGDDTLWSIQRLYRNIQEAVSIFISSRYGRPYGDVLAAIVAACESYMVKNQKFSRTLFPCTCCNTCATLVPEISHEDLLSVYKIADSVFDFEPKIFDDTIPTLIELGRLGYKSFILTQGDYMVQSSKIFRLKLYDYVSDTIIVDVKTAQTYVDLIEKYPTIERYIMVGDSDKRDIVPAKMAGWETLKIRRFDITPGVQRFSNRVIYRLSDVVKYIEETDNDPEYLDLIRGNVK